MKNTVRSLLLATFCVTALAACSGKTEKADPNPTPHDSVQGPGLFSGESGNILQAFRKDPEALAAAALPVNPYLWRAALESVSFMPLAEVDSTGGVITTDWYVTPANANERVKVNILILGRKLSPQSLKVNLFKQIKTASGSWTGEAVNKETITKLEDAILTNARRLRVKERASQ